jgi:hypothetical protein
MKSKSSAIFAVFGLAIASSASAAVLFTDDFTVTGTPSTANLNFNNSGRQGGTQATENWTGLGNSQIGNNTVFGGSGDYLMVADAGARATLGTLNLAPLVASNQKLVISFDIRASAGGYGWGSFTLGNLVAAQTYGISQPDTANTEFAFIYRNSTGINAWDNGASLMSAATTTGGSNFTFTFTDAATELASPFGVNAKVTIQNGLNTIGTYNLNGGLSANTYITFGTSDFGGANGGRASIDNLVVQTIPEPSAALLGGLGMLALLRRKR